MQWSGLRTHIEPHRDPTPIAAGESMALSGQRCFQLAPYARAASRRQVAGVLGQPRRAQLPLRCAHVVFDREEARAVALQVEDERPRQRVALARLADAAGVQEPPVVTER